MASFAINTRIFFGRNGIVEAQGYIEKLGIKKLAFIVDSNIVDLKVFRNLFSAFEDEGHLFEIIKEFDATIEPSYDILDKFTESFRGMEIDAIIGVGGGSVLDLSKGVGILLKNPGKALDYRGMNKVKKPGVPVICYPTTAGTGTEVTHTASFIDKESMTKLGINGQYVSPLWGVLVPELTFSCPKKVTIGSGLDALLHAIEAVSAKTSNPITKMLGSNAFSLLYINIMQAVSEPENYAAKEGMLLGSYYAGIAMMNAGGGPASGISYPLGVHYGVPHGIAGGIFLPHVFSYNVEMGYQGYAKVYDCLPNANLKLTDKEKNRLFAQEFNKLYERIGAPPRLEAWGWKEIDVEYLTRLTMTERKANLDLNPVFFGEQEVRDLLGKVV